MRCSALLATGSVLLATLAPLAAGAQAQFYTDADAWRSALGTAPTDFGPAAPVADGTRTLCDPSPGFVQPAHPDGCYVVPTYHGIGVLVLSRPGLPTARAIGAGGTVGVGGEAYTLHLDLPGGTTAFGAYLTTNAVNGQLPPSYYPVNVSGTNLVGRSVGGGASETVFLGLVAAPGQTLGRVTFSSPYGGLNDPRITVSGIAFTATPEPSTFVLSAAGLLALGAAARRRPRTGATG